MLRHLFGCLQISVLGDLNLDSPIDNVCAAFTTHTGSHQQPLEATKSQRGPPGTTESHQKPPRATKVSLLKSIHAVSAVWRHPRCRCGLEASTLLSHASDGLQAPWLGSLAM